MHTNVKEADKERRAEMAGVPHEEEGAAKDEDGLWMGWTGPGRSEP